MKKTVFVTLLLIASQLGLTYGQTSSSEDNQDEVVSHLGFGIDVISLLSGVASVHGEWLNPNRTFGFEGSLVLGHNFFHLRGGVVFHNNLDLFDLWFDTRAGVGILSSEAGFDIISVPFFSLNGLVGFRWYVPLGIELKPYAELGVGISYITFKNGNGFSISDFGPGMRLVVGLSL